MITVRSMPADVGTTGWNAILPAREPEPALAGKHDTDFLIIGAGFAGLSAARRLIQLAPEARITVLEGRQVATGPAGRNSGFMIDLPHELTSEDYAGSSADNDRRHTAMNRAAIRFAQAAATEYAMPAEAAVASGKTNAAATDKGMQHNADYAAHLSALGEDYRLFDAVEMKALTGTDYYQGGLWTPGTLMLQPALYVRGLAAGLLQHQPVTLYEQSPVLSLHAEKGHWLATTPQGEVRASKVILAVNGLVEHFGFYQRRLMPVMLYASMTRPLTPAEVNTLGGEANWGLTPADPLGTTVRRIAGMGGDRIIIRNRANYDPGQQPTAARMQSVARTHEQSFRDRFPMLTGVTMEHCWSGRLSLSLNGAPAWGEVADGLYSACCQNGLGAAKGTVAGIIAAEQACGSRETLMPDYQQDVLPKRLPPEPFMWLGANAVMRWKEWRAGREF